MKRVQLHRALATAVVTGSLVVAAAGTAWAAPVVVTTLSPSLTPTALANSLAGTGVTISNVSYTGADTAAGTFTGGGGADNVVGFDQGVVLSTGLADVGTSNTSDARSGTSSGAGDADLDALGAGATRDATVLEFDVTPNAGTLFFNYVFASDEYNEYVYGGVNDVFGFFVTKAGETTKANCAVLADGPDADTLPDPVSVDTINGGNPFGDANASHPELYRNNDLSDGGTIPAEPDGFTKVLQCEAAVVPNQANHLKLAISDVGDTIYDSWVFLQANSISTSPEVCGDGIDNDGNGQVDEGCAVNHPPTASAGGPYSGAEGSAIAVSGTASDQDGDAVTHTWSATPVSGVDAGAACTFADASALSTTVTCTDDGTWKLTLTASDGNNPPVSSDATLTVANANPSTSITSPADMTIRNVGQAVAVSATESDPGSNDVLSCTISWGDGTSGAGTSSGGTCTGSHTYAAAGTYDITVTVSDDDGGSASATVTVVIQDAATKVTGGGFVVDGKRWSFGFVAKPGSGQLTVHNNATKTRFKGTTVTSLSVSGRTATWTGTGRVGTTTGYTFTVSVADNGTGANQPRDTITFTATRSGSPTLHFSGALKGGNIVIH